MGTSLCCSRDSHTVSTLNNSGDNLLAVVHQPMPRYQPIIQKLKRKQGPQGTFPSHYLSQTFENNKDNYS